jgi:hypothetical protein
MQIYGQTYEYSETKGRFSLCQRSQLSVSIKSILILPQRVKSVHSLLFYLFKTNLHIILPSTSSSTTLSLPYICPTKHFSCLFTRSLFTILLLLLYYIILNLYKSKISKWLVGVCVFLYVLFRCNV